MTAGSSSYNSGQINWRHTSGRLQTLVGYTFSKAFDNSSGYGEQINPVNPKVSRGLSAFDSTHNFVASYAYSLPIDKLGGPKLLTNGWQISGITRFSTGLPVTLVETDDQSLLGTGFGGPITLAVDTPNQIGPLDITNPRNHGGQFFSPMAFGPVRKATQDGDFFMDRVLTILTLLFSRTLTSPNVSTCSFALSFLISSITLNS